MSRGTDYAQLHLSHSHLTERERELERELERLEERLLESLHWLRENAPGRAYEVLRAALEDK